MLAIFALSLLIFTQTTLASSSDDDSLDLRDLSRLLEAEKRYADKYAASMRAKKETAINTRGFVKQCDQDPIDLGLIIDSSVSVPERDFKKGLKFLASFLDEFNIGPGDNQVRVAAVPFARGVYTQDGFNFTTYDDKEQVKDHVRTMPFRGGGSTDTGDAIKYMRKVQMAMRRSWAVQMTVVLTHGNSQKPRVTKTEAMETKEANITVFAVGVGHHIKRRELLNIAGRVKEHVFQVASYNDLDEEFKNKITRKTCKLVPKPKPQIEPGCKLEFPVDINFVFSAATMGAVQTATVTSFIRNVIKQEEPNEDFQYGVVSGDCPDDEGFRLNQYNTPGDIRRHLERYDRNNLPNIIRLATKTRFTPENGGRSGAIKIAVIFPGKNKVDEIELAGAIEEMLASGIRVFVSAPDNDILNADASYLPHDVILLEGKNLMQAIQLVNHLCPSFI